MAIRSTPSARNERSQALRRCSGRPSRSQRPPGRVRPPLVATRTSFRGPLPASKRVGDQPLVVSEIGIVETVDVGGVDRGVRPRPARREPPRCSPVGEVVPEGTGACRRNRRRVPRERPPRGCGASRPARSGRSIQARPSWRVRRRQSWAETTPCLEERGQRRQDLRAGAVDAPVAELADHTREAVLVLIRVELSFPRCRLSFVSSSATRVGEMGLSAPSCWSAAMGSSRRPEWMTCHLPPKWPSSTGAVQCPLAGVGCAGSPPSPEGAAGPWSWRAPPGPAPGRRGECPSLPRERGEPPGPGSGPLRVPPNRALPAALGR